MTSLTPGRTIAGQGDCFLHVEVAMRSLTAVATVALILSLWAPARTSVAAGNEFAFSFKEEIAAIYDGLRGNQNIRTDPATIVGIGYVHQTQVALGDMTGDFVAVGTYNGLAATGCANSSNPSWSVYTDGVIGGQYFCNTEQVNAYARGANPSFQIYYGVCQLINRWGMVMGGVVWECRTSAWSAGDRVSAGLETLSNPANFTDRNIDVKYTNMQFSLINQTGYLDFGGGAACCSYKDDFYSYQFLNDRAFNVYLAPLD